MAKVLEERERYKRERKIPLQHGGDGVGVGVQCGKITERVTLEGGGGLGKMNASRLLHLLLRPAWRLCAFHLLNILIWEAKSARCIFRLLAQGLVLNAETSKSSNLGAVAELREDEDEAYFSSYGHYGIHEEMLKVWVMNTRTNTSSRIGQQVSSVLWVLLWEATCYAVEKRVHQYLSWMKDFHVVCTFKKTVFTHALILRTAHFLKSNKSAEGCHVRHGHAG